jgi:hypothetical protein
MLLKDGAELRQCRHRIAQHVVSHDRDAAGIRHEQAGQQWNSVDLPAPLGPSSAMNSPADAEKLTPSTARTAP